MKKLTFALIAAGLMASSMAFAGEKVSENPVNGKKISILSHKTAVFMVGSYDANGKADFATIHRGGVVNQSPDEFGIAVKKSRATAANILATKAFTVNFPNEGDATQMAQLDYVGNHSNAKMPELDKPKVAGIEVAKSDVVNAPVATAFPYILHCELVDKREGEKMYFFIGEVKKVEVDKALIDAEGHVNVPNPYYGAHTYFKAGESLGKVGELFKTIVKE